MLRKTESKIYKRYYGVARLRVEFFYLFNCYFWVSVNVDIIFVPSHLKKYKNYVGLKSLFQMVEIWFLFANSLTILSKSRPLEHLYHHPGDQRCCQKSSRWGMNPWPPSPISPQVNTSYNIGLLIGRPFLESVKYLSKKLTVFHSNEFMD